MQTQQLNFEDRSVGELVSEDYRRADIFKSFGIDFCCGGKKTVKDACAEKDVNMQGLSTALADLAIQPSGPKQDPRQWDLDFLCDYIVNTHHHYVEQSIPQIQAYTEKVASVHGSGNPNLVKIAACFKQVAGEMVVHMRKEELILFPYIKKMAAARKAGEPLAQAPFGSIRNPINAMEADHENAGNLMATIRELSHEFTLPEQACATYQVSFARLSEFEEDLHRHVHLENNILFPAAFTMENELFGPND